MGCALPSISTTSCPAGVRAFSRNIQRCGMKLRVTPLSGLYSKILMQPSFLLASRLLAYLLAPNGWRVGGAYTVTSSQTVWECSGLVATKYTMSPFVSLVVTPRLGV